eukprot:TRINITY_DN1502_c0_g1_i1.p1 TRINITY_DN1502_c0_g1~~TRINITY_DN1502_c0_g1_i1.p1  ORF type:complete len:206 (+),score=69.58 TRINITY_DN1502_c0_g1_i1:165-782(+)
MCIRDRKMPKHNKRPWTAVLPDANPQAIDLIDKLLNYDPVSRLTAAEGLEHPYLEALHQPDDEPVADSVFELDWEQEQGLTVDAVKQLIHLEICKINPEAATPTDKMADARISDTSPNKGTEGGEVAVVHGQMTRMLRKPAELPQLLEMIPVSYTHLRAHETVLDLVCRLLLEKKKTKRQITLYEIMIRKNNNKKIEIIYNDESA